MSSYLHACLITKEQKGRTPIHQPYRDRSNRLITPPVSLPPLAPARSSRKNVDRVLQLEPELSLGATTRPVGFLGLETWMPSDRGKTQSEHLDLFVFAFCGHRGKFCVSSMSSVRSLHGIQDLHTLLREYCSPIQRFCTVRWGDPLTLGNQRTRTEQARTSEPSYSSLKVTSTRLSRVGSTTVNVVNRWPEGRLGRCEA